MLPGRTVNSSLTAVCIAGALRTFLQPVVQQSWLTFLHRSHYEYFVSTDQPINDAAGSLLIAPVRAWIASGPTGFFDDGRPNTPLRDKLPRGRCPRGTCNPFRFLLPFAHRLAELYYALQQEEGSRRIRYGHVLRLRPDHLILALLPAVGGTGVPPDSWLGVPLPLGTLLLWDDQIMLARRDDAAAALLAPSLAYATCADEAQWKLAVAAGRQQLDPQWSLAKCRQSGLVPCTAMALVMAFGGGVKHWRELPLRSRRWQPTITRREEHFCIKRQRFVNETEEYSAGRAAKPEFEGAC